MTKLSIIVPVYNAAEYLSQCLDSLIHQTYSDIEIICVNDGSTDASAQILAKYAQADNRITVITQENGGQSIARNSGLNVAHGEYVTFVDSDDYVDIDTYEIVMNHIGDADVACFGIDVFGDTNYQQRNGDNDYYKLRYSGIQKVTNKLLLETDCSCCNKVFKKSIIDKYKIQFPAGLHYEDAYFYFAYMIVSSVAYFIDKYMYHYRRHANSTMTNTFGNGNHAVEHLTITDKLYEYLSKNGYFINNYKLFENIFSASFNCALKYAKFKDMPEICGYASALAQKMFKNVRVHKKAVWALIKQKYDNVCEPDLTWYQKLFSINRVWVPLDGYNRKNLYILGVKFTFKPKNADVLTQINKLHADIEELKYLSQGGTNA